MGIFSDPCGNEDCRARVKRGAQFCSKCGWAGPNSLVPCGECGKRVGGESAFCWSCGADLLKSKPPRIVGNYCVRAEDEFAVRVDPEDLQGFMKRRITVEPGTLGLVEREGKLVKVTHEGPQTLDGVLKLGGPASIYMISATDAVLRPTFHGLGDAGGAQLDVTVHVVLRVADCDAFVRHFFQDRKRRVTYSMLEDSVVDELNMVLRGLIHDHALADMYGNLEWRNKLETDLRTAMEKTLSRYGFELLQVSFVDFGGDDYEEYRGAKRETYMGSLAADHLAEQVAVRRRMAELQNQDKLAGITSDKELAHKVRELNTQYGVRAVLLDAELEDAVKHSRHEQAVKDKMRSVELYQLDQETHNEAELIQVQHRNQVDMMVVIARTQRDATEGDFRREQKRHDHELQMKMEEERMRLRHHDEGFQDDRLRKMKEEERAAQKDMMAHAKEMEAEKAKVPLAEIDAKVKIAESGAGKEAAVGKAEADLLKDIMRTNREDAARHEDNLVKLGSAQARPAVVIPGSPMMPMAGVPYGGDPSQAPCPKCQRPVSLTATFCGWCGHEMTKKG